MNEKDLKSMIESILNEMVGNETVPAAEAVKEVVTKAVEVTAPQEGKTEFAVGGLVQATMPAQEQLDDGECLDDITDIDLRKLLLVPDPEDREGYLKMKEKHQHALAYGVQAHDTRQLRRCASVLTMLQHKMPCSPTCLRTS